MFATVNKTLAILASAAVVLTLGVVGVSSPANAAASKNACQNANQNSNVECIFPVTQTLTGTENQAITPTSTFTLTSKYSTPVTYSIAPALPAGLSLDTATGVISGTPTAASSATEYTISLSDSSTPAVTGDAYITITINAGQGQTPDRKVTICHRTHATTNPYVRITVDYNSVNKTKGHSGHDEIFQDAHVYDASISYKGKDKLWGDIIPADASGLNRWQPLNWTTLGEQIYNGTVAGCPSYNPTTYYNKLREAGVPEAKIKQEIADLEAEQEEADPNISKTNTGNLHYTGSNSKVSAQETDKVTICHRTNSVTNPYRKITVAASSITNTKGHLAHDDIYLTHHVFDSSVNYPANAKDWGDIIPADPTGANRWQPLNWTDLGQQIYSGAVAGCAEQTTQEYYNTLRESGLKKKDIKKDLETQGNIDDDPVDIADIHYDGTDPKVEKSEPKVPELPANVDVPDQSLSGIVWLDLNKDGLKDPDEPLMPNIELTVLQVAPITPASVPGAIRRASVRTLGATTTVKTDANGFYIFPSLGAGDWKVVTTIPQSLGVTYDSQGGAEGEVVTTVPVASSAFTWVGLVGDTVVATNKTYEEILTAYPNAVPLSELPAWLQAKVLKILNEDGLAETGLSLRNPWVDAALLLVAGSALVVASRRRKRKL